MNKNINTDTITTQPKLKNMENPLIVYICTTLFIPTVYVCMLCLYSVSLNEMKNFCKKIMREGKYFSFYVKA